MRTLIAGQGGTVLVAAARRSEPPAALALEGLPEPATHRGIPAFGLPDLHRIVDVDRVEFVGGEASTATALRTWAAERGYEVVQAHPEGVSPPDGVRVVAVSSVSAGSGKTALVRRIAKALRGYGADAVSIRHPLPDLLAWEGRDGAHVIAEPTDVEAPRSLTEQAEAIPVAATGVPVVVGTDPEAMLDAAAERLGAGGVILWDGGGSATPWIRPDLHLLVVDALRPPPADLAERVVDADVVVLAKADAASDERVSDAERTVRDARPDVPVLLVDLPVAVPESRNLKDRNAVVVEEWSALLLGGLRAGAGAVAARRFRCGVVDPRPFAVGAVAEALERHPGIGPVVPALGRSPGEISDLRETIRAMPGDVVLWASFASPLEVVGAGRRPVVRAYPEMIEVAGGSIGEIVRRFLEDG